jgi:CRP/FNR family transcriptional regulator, cyclic AMP receptor protein
MTVGPTLAMLLANPWFTDLPAPVIKRITDMAQRRRFADGGLIHHKGDEPSGLFGVVSGSVKVSSTLPDGREAILTYLEPGQWFGEIALFDGRARTHDAWAVGSAELLHLPRPMFNRMLADMPELYPHFIRLLCTRVRAAFAFIEDSALLPLPARLAKRVLQLAEAYGSARGKLTVIDLHMPQEELGAMLSISRQSVNKELKAWERQGWVRVEYGRLVIDPLALATLVAQQTMG